MNKVFRHKLSKIFTAIAHFLIKEFCYKGRPLPNAEMSTGQLEKQQIFAINNFNYILKQKNLKEFLLKEKRLLNKQQKRRKQKTMILKSS